ncbi:hypothetical protein [Pseudomonas sp. 10S4]|uniref:hypothetical protein n=1 Tax=Pseudomonas sp. 10S4 TaxID=3048583 RepID=UPI002AC8989A|nr:MULTISPECIES: hypothetical protein [unclassified Pseudomonas]MEB0223318.1 hypothetical protein [Pseudomonas sp. 5S1]MEB0294953.1 hypothetical protein [Pseudomonas sp. 10S4]WPX18982.1 hypothetical protein RHM58_02395 [Pseudomonas sp. 10S4]
MASENRGLILQQRLIRHDPANLHCREINLRLSADCRQLVLSRYTEHYGPALVRWIERSHTVSVTDLFRWLVANGEADVMKIGTQPLP